MGCFGPIVVVMLWHAGPHSSVQDLRHRTTLALTVGRLTLLPALVAAVAAQARPAAAVVLVAIVAADIADGVVARGTNTETAASGADLRMPAGL